MCVCACVLIYSHSNQTREDCLRIHEVCHLRRMHKSLWRRLKLCCVCLKPVKPRAHNRVAGHTTRIMFLNFLMDLSAIESEWKNTPLWTAESNRILFLLQVTLQTWTRWITIKPYVRLIMFLKVLLLVPPGQARPCVCACVLICVHVNNRQRRVQEVTRMNGLVSLTETNWIRWSHKKKHQVVLRCLKAEILGTWIQQPLDYWDHWMSADTLFQCRVL